MNRNIWLVVGVAAVVASGLSYMQGGGLASVTTSTAKSTYVATATVQTKSLTVKTGNDTESLLATFKVRVKPTSKIEKKDTVYISPSIRYADGTQSSGQGQVVTVMVNGVTADSLQSVQLDLSKTNTIEVTITANARLMLSGKYYAELSLADLGDPTGLINFSALPAKTGSKTIVGEKSPYITSMKTPTISTSTQTSITLDISGKNLKTVNSVMVNGAAYPKADRSSQSDTHLIIDNLGFFNPGQYSVQLGSTKGNSNMFYFTVEVK